MNTEVDNPLGGFEMVAPSLSVLKHHRYAVFLWSLVLSIIGVVGVSLIPDTYRATTTILVDPQKIPERYISSTITSDPNAHLNTLTQQVLSASRIQEIIESLSLYPELRKKDSKEELIDYIRSKIKIEVKPGAEQGLSSFSITYTDHNRWLVAPIANGLAGSFIDANLQARQQQATVTTQFLASELDAAQTSLREQETALQSFRLQHSGATPDQLGGNLQALSRLQADVQANREAISRLEEERLILTQQRPVETRDPASLSERSRLILERNRLDAEIQNLRRQYTDTYPDVVSARAQRQLVQANISSLPMPDNTTSEQYDPGTQLRLTLIGKEVDRHKQQLAVLESQISGYQGKVQSVPILETQLAELTRNYETSRLNYQSLLDKKLSAGMSENLERKQQAERFTVLDPASTPEKPFKPTRVPLFIGAIFGALLLSTGTAIMRSILLGAVRSQGELSSLLPKTVSILGAIPPITSLQDTRALLRQRWQTACLSIVLVSLLIAFLLKVRPSV